MRLLNTNDHTFSEHYAPNIPVYAILSHRWEANEVTYQEVRDKQNLNKAGWLKVKSFCAFALGREYRHVWIDTCCIDKSSSTELTEAINSMYKWYRNAMVCYVYLCDLEPNYPSQEEFNNAFNSSLWHTRGWTLQELLAPANNIFIAKDWKTEIGTKVTLQPLISEATGIIDLTPGKIFDHSIATRMSWASNRSCTREEDMAYSLMGLFDVNMPLLYGEGDKAFMRLQQEILKISSDETIFAWTTNKNSLEPMSETRHDHDAYFSPLSGLLSSSLANFSESSNLTRLLFDEERPPYSMTNKGLQFQPLCWPAGFGSCILVPLNCAFDGKTPCLVTLCTQKSLGSRVWLRQHTNVSFHEMWRLYHEKTTQSPRRNEPIYIWQHNYSSWDRVSRFLPST